MWKLSTVICAKILSCIDAVLPYEEFVNTLAGTNSTPELSHGNVLPLVVRPWGMNAWSLDNKGASGNAWWFNPLVDSFAGIRCTHQPSPWLGDYGQFWILPFASSNGHPPLNALGGPVYTYHSDVSAWKPYYWSASLFDSGFVASLELTSSHRGAIIRVRFNETFPGKRQIAIINSDFSTMR